MTSILNKPLVTAPPGVSEGELAEPPVPETIAAVLVSLPVLVSRLKSALSADFVASVVVLLKVPRLSWLKNVLNSSDQTLVSI
mgnify:CR=1 FL=1